MITVGSIALLPHLPEDIRESYRRGKFMDTDYLCTEQELEFWLIYYLDKDITKYERNGNKVIIMYKNKPHKELEIATPGSSTELIIEYCKKHEADCKPGGYHPEAAPLNVLYMLKMSHRFRKNSPHFLKTMKDIHLMRSLGATIPEDLQDIYELRMKETYDNSHPKLNVNSKDFFSDDGVPYVYEHDDIHKVVALLDKPAFMYYMKDGEEVMTSKEKFFSAEEHIRLLGVYEESCVLAIERSQIPNNFKVDPERSFMVSLVKVCTSITSGWFREYAWESFFKVVELYHKLGKDDYVNRFKQRQNECRPYQGENNV